MSFGNTFENDLMGLIFNGTPIAGIADNAASGPLSDLYLALHTADPGEAGGQNANETTYTGYARVAVSRSTGGFTAPVDGSCNLAAPADFPQGTGGSGSVEFFSVGTSSGGAGKIIMKGPVAPTIPVGDGIIPRLTTATVFTLN